MRALVTAAAIVVGSALFGVAARASVEASPSPPRARGAQSRSLTDGVFTTEQAERGAALYREHCSECHQPDQYKGFLPPWSGLPVSYMLDVIRRTMPQNDPDSLETGEYVDVLTYIFSINELPAGDEELPAEREALDAVMIAAPPSGSGATLFRLR